MKRSDFIAFVRATRLGVVATVNASGAPEAALVGIAVTDQGEVIFDSLAASRKVANISSRARVAMVIGWEDEISVQLEGEAEVLAGPERDSYGRVYLDQFPGARVLAPDFAVIRVRPTWLRHYDARSVPARVIEDPLA
jgi:general stress protein 26